MTKGNGHCLSRPTCYKVLIDDTDMEDLSALLKEVTGAVRRNM